MNNDNYNEIPGMLGLFNESTAFILLGLTLTFLIHVFFSRRYFEKKGVLFPFSTTIFILSISLIVVAYTDITILSYPLLYIFFLSFPIFSLITSNNRIYINNKLEDKIYDQFKNLSYQNFFLTKPDLINYLITKSKAGRSFDFINIITVYIIILLGFAGFFSELFTSERYYLFVIFVSYAVYFLNCILVHSLTKHITLDFEVTLDLLFNSSQNQKVLTNEVPNGPSYMLDLKNDLLVMVDGSIGARAYFSTNIDNFTKERLHYVLERSNTIGEQFKNEENN